MNNWKKLTKILKIKVTIDIVLVLSLILFALFIRIGVVASPYGYSMCTTLREPSYFFCSDDAVYMMMARYLVHGDFSKVLNPIWPPLFPVVSALAFLVFHNWAISPRVVSILFGGLLIIPLYIISIRYFSRSVAVTASILLALFSPLVFASVHPLSESLGLFTLWTGIAFLLLAFSESKLLLAFFAGLFFGLTALSRVEGIFAFASFLIFFVIYRFFKKINTRKYLKFLLCVIIGFFIVYTPYQIGTYNKFHTSTFFGRAAAELNFYSEFKLTSNGRSTFGQDFDSLETINLHSEIYSGFWNILTTRYQQVINDTLTRMRIELGYILSYLSIIELLLLFFGFIFFYRTTKKNKEIVFLYIIFFITFLGTNFFAPQAEERYIYWLLPIIPLLVSLGLVNIVKALGNYMHLRNVTLTVMSIFVLIYLTHMQLINSFRYVTNIASITNKPYIIPEDDWLMKHDPGKRVMMHHEGYAFYSQSFIVYTPDVDTVGDLVKYAHLWKVSYIVAEYGEIPDQLKFLLDEPKDYPGLKLIKGKNMQLYKVL